MGIRESLEQPDKDLNLKNFTMPEDEPEDELEFDVEKEITEEEKSRIMSEQQEILIQFEQSNEPYYVEEAARLLRETLIIFDDKSKISDELWQKTRTILAKEVISYTAEKEHVNKMLFLPRFLRNLRQLFPNQFDKLPIVEIIKKNLDFFKNEFKKKINKSFLFYDTLSIQIPDNSSLKLSSHWLDLADFRIICPNEFAQLDLDYQDWQKTSKTLPSISDFQREIKRIDKECQNDPEYFNENPSAINYTWEKYADMLAQLRIIWPEYFHEINLKEFWKNARKEIKFIRENTFSEDKEGNFTSVDLTRPHYLSFFTNLKILAAKEVKITDQGLELVMPEKQSHQQKIPPRPERRI